MDAAELFIETLDMCEVGGCIVEKGALTECLDCGLHFCMNHCCDCVVTGEDGEVIEAGA